MGRGGHVASASRAGRGSRRVAPRRARVPRRGLLGSSSAYEVPLACCAVPRMSGWYCGRMDSAWISPRFPRHQIKLKVYELLVGVGTQTACVPRRFASRGGCSHRQGWGPSALCWGLSALSYRRLCPGEALRRCPTDACVPVGSLGVVLCGPPERSLLSMCLWAHWSTTGGTAWKPRGNRGRGDMET